MLWTFSAVRSINMLGKSDISFIFKKLCIWHLVSAVNEGNIIFLGADLTIIKVAC